jgi:hypothetical protein
MEFFEASMHAPPSTLLFVMILKHEARRWSSVNGGANHGERK